MFLHYNHALLPPPFSQITDAKYAWGYLTSFEELLKKKISQDPLETLFLHMVFLKFQSWLNAPLQRIKQCERFVSWSYAYITIKVKS